MCNLIGKKLVCKKSVGEISKGDTVTITGFNKSVSKYKGTLSDNRPVLLSLAEITKNFK